MRHIGLGTTAIAMVVLIVGAACGDDDLGQRQSTQLVRNTPTPAVSATQPAASSATETPVPPADEPTETPTPDEAMEEEAMVVVEAMEPAMEAPVGKTLEVEIVDFTLPELKIEVGTTVNWINRDPFGHTSSSGTPEEPTELWDTGILIASKTDGHTFTEEGTFLYYCKVHPAGMQATVTVVAAGAAMEPAMEEEALEPAVEEEAMEPAMEEEAMEPAMEEEAMEPAMEEEAMEPEATTEPTATPAPAATPAPTATPTAIPAPTSTPTPVPVVRNSSIKSTTLENIVFEAGTTVTWVNEDPVRHTVTSGTPTDRTDVWDSLTLNQDDIYSFVFAEEGEFQYFCKFHPSTMQATVTIVGAGQLEEASQAEETSEPEPVQRSSDIKLSSLEDLVVEVGTTVTWTNLDSVPHTSTSGTPTDRTEVWDSQVLSQNDQYAFTFMEEGEFAYFCNVHPSFMSATVTVVAQGELGQKSSSESEADSGGYLEY